MLVLTRKQNEKIRIGQDITITVLRMKGKGVRLGIEAPQDINVIRGELCFEEPGQTSRDSEDAIVPPKSKPRTSGSRTLGNEATTQWPLDTRREHNASITRNTVPVDTTPVRSLMEPQV